MKLEDIFDRVVQDGVEIWDITSLYGPLAFSGVLIDNAELAKELKRRYKNGEESLNLLYEKINAPLFVLEKCDGKPRPSKSSFLLLRDGKEIYMEDMLAAREYVLSKDKSVTFKKIEEYNIFMYRSWQKIINSNGFNCLHENECPVSYLDRWHK